MNVVDAFKAAIADGSAKSAREATGMSQTDVADVLGTSPAAVSRWESGSRVPREDLAGKYLAAIGIMFQDDDDDECPPGQHRMPDGSCMENDVHPTGDRYEIEGVAVLEGQWTGDGRQFAEGGLSWPDPSETNIPLQWQKESSHGGDHDVTVNVGRVTNLARDGKAIRVAAIVDGGSEDGAEAVRRMTSDPPTLAGVSIVADDPENGDIEVVFEGDDPVGVLFHTGRIRALTLVDIPAFVEGAISISPITANMTDAEIFGPTGKSVSSSPWSGSTSRFTDEQYRMSAAGCDSGRGETAKEQCFLPHHEPGGAVSRAGVHNAAARANQTEASAESLATAKAHLRSHYTRDLGEDPPESLSMTDEERALVGETEDFHDHHHDDGLDELRAIVAAATTITIDDAPPREWFDEPSELPAAGAITITDEGRIYGLLAPKDIAHRAFRKKRVTVPTGNVDYSRWMNRETITADGSRISTGPITMECGHASVSPLFRSNPDNAFEHMDNSCSIFARARIGENKHGVWIAGALLPDVDKPKVARAMMCQLSGDWQNHRESPGMREFVAALLVPVPGFPVGDNDPSIRMNDGLLVSSASPVTWFASGAVPDDEADDDFTDAEADAVIEQIKAENADTDGVAIEDAVIDDLPEVKTSTDPEPDPVPDAADDKSDAPAPQPEPVGAAADQGTAGASDIVIDDLPSPDEAVKAREDAAAARKAEARERIKQMRADLGLEDE